MVEACVSVCAEPRSNLGTTRGRVALSRRFLGPTAPVARWLGLGVGGGRSSGCELNCVQYIDRRVSRSLSVCNQGSVMEHVLPRHSGPVWGRGCIERHTLNTLLAVAPFSRGTD